MFDISKLPRLPQRQDSLEDQLKDLVAAADALGMYDAADFIKRKHLPLDSHTWCVSATGHPYMTGYFCKTCGTSCCIQEGERPFSPKPCK
jgi:hypothetical protein